MNGRPDNPKFSDLSEYFSHFRYDRSIPYKKSIKFFNGEEEVRKRNPRCRNVHSDHIQLLWPNCFILALRVNQKITCDREHTDLIDRFQNHHFLKQGIQYIDTRVITVSKHKLLHNPPDFKANNRVWDRMSTIISTSSCDWRSSTMRPVELN
jgi:hypothetical protein